MSGWPNYEFLGVFLQNTNKNSCSLVYSYMTLTILLSAGFVSILMIHPTDIIRTTYATSQVDVTIPKFALTEDHFQPKSITIEKGTAVRWTNNDFLLHAITFGIPKSSGTGPDSSYIIPGESFQYQFNKVGHFKYFCSLHPTNTGLVIVKNVIMAPDTGKGGPPIR
jgi:plastocyanin